MVKLSWIQYPSSITFLCIAAHLSLHLSHINMLLSLILFRCISRGRAQSIWKIPFIPSLSLVPCFPPVSPIFLHFPPPYLYRCSTKSCVFFYSWLEICGIYCTAYKVDQEEVWEWCCIVYTAEIIGWISEVLVKTGRLINIYETLPNYTRDFG